MQNLFFISSRGFSSVKLPPPSCLRLRDGLREPEPYLGGRDADGRSREAVGGLALMSLGCESSPWLQAWIWPFSITGMYFRRLFGGIAVLGELPVPGMLMPRHTHAASPAALAARCPGWGPSASFWAENRRFGGAAMAGGGEGGDKRVKRSLGVLQKALQPHTSPAKLCTWEESRIHLGLLKASFGLWEAK